MNNFLNRSVLLSVAFLFIGTPEVFAATIGFFPAAATFSAGERFGVGVYVSSPDQPVNAASGSISFPAGIMEVVSLTKGATFNLWIKEPEFSNTAGTINFEGIVLNPGFKGPSGKVLDIVFRAKGAGTASLDFKTAAVLANDGKGTNMQAKAGAANYTIVPLKTSVANTAAVQALPQGNLPAPEIFSLTHPDQGGWYSGNAPVFSWKNSKSVISVRLAIDEDPVSKTRVEYLPPITEKKVDDLDSGIWYFHLQQKDQNGWGKTANFRINIDNEPPVTFQIIVDGGRDNANPRPVLSFGTADGLSGIDRYSVKIDDKSPVETREMRLKSDFLKTGNHNITVIAYDRAGNYFQATTTINIIPIAEPKVLKYRSRLDEGSPFLLKGISPANVMVNIFLQDQAGEIIAGQVRSDDAGFWDYNGFPLEAGVYLVWANNIDETGAASDDSEKIVVTVEKPPFIRYGRIAVDYLSVIVTLLALVGISICGFVWIAGFLRNKKTRVGSQISEAQKASFTAFSLLKKEVQDQVAKIDGRPGLSKREKQVSDDLKDALDISEKFVAKEIKEIKDEVDKK